MKIDYSKATMSINSNAMTLNCTICNQILITSIKEDLNYLNVLWEHHIDNECKAI